MANELLTSLRLVDGRVLQTLADPTRVRALLAGADQVVLPVPAGVVFVHSADVVELHAPADPLH